MLHSAKLPPTSVKMSVEINWIQLTITWGSAALRHTAPKQQAPCVKAPLKNHQRWRALLMVYIRAKCDFHQIWLMMVEKVSVERKSGMWPFWFVAFLDFGHLGICSTYTARLRVRSNYPLTYQHQLKMQRWDLTKSSAQDLHRPCQVQQFGLK